jgi:hypothetical protein
MTTPILTGIHYDMAERDYRLATAIAGSDAKHILPPKTPAHYAAHMAGELKREPSKPCCLALWPTWPSLSRRSSTRPLWRSPRA